jgi:hypothetical protein
MASRKTNHPNSLSQNNKGITNQQSNEYTFGRVVKNRFALASYCRQCIVLCEYCWLVKYVLEYYDSGASAKNSNCEVVKL